METGNVKQVATFEKLVSFCNANGATFNPSKASMKSTALNTLLTSAQQSLEAVRTARTAHENAVNTRKQAFDSLPKFMTRIVNILASTDAHPDTVQEAYFFSRKFYSNTQKKTKPPDTAEGATGELPQTRSTSELDFDSKVENFAGLVKVVSTEPLYKPNETELQAAALNTFVTGLRDKHKAVLTAEVILSNARAARNKVLYGSAGIHGIGLAVKRYVKGLFGFKSIQYGQISGLQFVKRPT